MKPPVLRFPFHAADGVHECRVEFDWLGAERYYVDDSLVLKQWSLWGRTAVIKTHAVEIQIRSFLARRQAVTEVRVDGKLVIANLLSEYNEALKANFRSLGHGDRKPMTFGQWFAKFAIWFSIALLFFVLFR